MALGIVGQWALGQDREFDFEFVLSHPILCESVPGSRRLGLVDRDDAIQEKNTRTAARVWTDCRNPNRQPESAEAARGTPAVSADENDGGFEIFETGLDPDRDQVQRQNPTGEIHA